MAYADITDIFVRYNPIKGMVGTNSNDIASADITSRFIPDASGVVDAYIGARYVTPLSDPVPQIITQVTADLSIFNLCAEKLPRQPDFMQARYDRALSTLTALRDGKMVLGSSVTAVTTGDNEAWSPDMGFHPTFSPTLRDVNQKADSDQQQAEIDDRTDDSFNGL